MDDAFLSQFSRLLDQIAPPLTKSEPDDAQLGVMWSAIQESGFVDALGDEGSGGAGLHPGDAYPLLAACGQRLLPVAFGETLVARALMRASNNVVPISTPIVLWPQDEDGRLHSLLPPIAGGATHALTQHGDAIALRPLLASSRKDAFGVSPAALDEKQPPVLEFALPKRLLLNWSAALTATAISGASASVLQLTLAHVNNRRQFGKPLGKFQAVQQQIAVMAEHVAAANMAAQRALSRGAHPSFLDAAIAKIAADKAADVACAVSHATHGAMGITAEYDLAPYSRQLKRWRLSFGTAAHWSELVGAARLQASHSNSIDFVRAP